MSQPSLESLLAAVQANDDEGAEQVVTSYTVASAPALSDVLALFETEDADQRWWAVRTAAAIAPFSDGGTLALEAPLRQRLHDADPAVRCAAALAAGHLHMASLVTELAHALGDESGWVRSSTADALALMGETAVPALLQVLAGTDQGARTRAAYALSKIRTMEVANAFYYCLQDENQLVQTYAYDTLEQMGLLQTILVM